MDQKRNKNMETQHRKIQRDSVKAVLRGNFTVINFQEKRMISKKQPNFTPQGTSKRRIN